MKHTTLIALVLFSARALAMDPWSVWVPANPDWVLIATDTDKEQFYIDRANYDQAEHWEFAQVVYPEHWAKAKDSHDPTPRVRSVFRAHFDCKNNAYQLVNATHWYESGATWDSPMPRLWMLPHLQPQPGTVWQAMLKAECNGLPMAAAPAKDSAPAVAIAPAPAIAPSPAAAIMPAPPIPPAPAVSAPSRRQTPTVMPPSAPTAIAGI